MPSETQMATDVIADLETMLVEERSYLEWAKEVRAPDIIAFHERRVRVLTEAVEILSTQKAEGRDHG